MTSATGFEAGADGLTVNFPDRLLAYFEKPDRQTQ